MGKNLVVCCDGTWNTPDQHSEDGKPCPTNVVHMARAILPVQADGTPQVVFYDQGVGTDPGLDHLLGGGLGLGLSKNVQDGFRFLCHNHADEDRIFLFGFSRGAFTARSLAGFIRNCGLLHKAELEHVPEAYELYRDRDKGPKSKEAIAFRERHSREVDIHFLGVWDTVGALGVPGDLLRGLGKRHFEFHDVELSGSVKHAYHALALDEQRVPFAPSIWSGAPKEEQVVQQVWFRGVHSDVGGGYPERGLSNLAFHWMKDRATAQGLAVDETYCQKQKGDAAAKPHDSLNWKYRLMGRHIRRPTGGVTEFIHPSAVGHPHAVTTAGAPVPVAPVQESP